MIVLAVTGAAQAQDSKSAPQVVTAPPGYTVPAFKAGNVEDWTKLTLEGSQLKPEPPLVGQKDNFPNFTRELLQVKWRQGDPIDLYVIRPKNVEKPPVMLYLYSYPSESSRFLDDSYCDRLTKGGIAAVGFVSALTGQRYTNRPMKQWFVSELQESLASTVHDVHLILDYLSTRNDLDLNKVGMFGQGSGGSIAILAAAVDPRIQTLDVLDPWADWPDWMAKSLVIPEEERPNYVKPEFLKKIEPLDPVKWLPQLKTQHIRIQQTASDLVPSVVQQKVRAAAPASAQVIQFDDLKQFFASNGGGKIFLWSKEQLRPGALAKPELAKHELTKPELTKPELTKSQSTPSQSPSPANGRKVEASSD
jgi:hypothetical protein